MKLARFLSILLTLILLLMGVVSVVSATTETPNTPAVLENVRSYAAANQADGLSYANVGGKLIAGNESGWHTVNFPQAAVASGLAIDPQQAQTIYVGAANETSLYRTTDGGESWLRVPLSTNYAGAVTTIAIDAAQNIIFAGTDQGTIYRIHELGTSMILGGQQTLPDPITQLAVDANGSNLAFARTTTSLYRADNAGLQWTHVDLLTVPTALAIAYTTPATVYVGTLDKGVMKTVDGYFWQNANEGLALNPGTRLKVDALSVDPLQPERLYVATSYLFGSTEVHQSPIGVAMSENGGSKWALLRAVNDVAVAELLPVSGKSAAVYALFANSRSPFALGAAQALVVTDTSTGAASWSNWFETVNIGQLLIVLMAGLAIVIATILVQRSRQQQASVTVIKE